MARNIPSNIPVHKSNREVSKQNNIIHRSSDVSYIETEITMK